MKLYILKVLFLVLCPTLLFSQETTVKGKVTDISTNEPIAYASITFIGIQGLKATSDFEGNYSIKTNKKVDSIKVSISGFATKIKYVNNGEIQTIDFQISTEQKELTATVFKAKANPAHRILDSCIQHKKINSPSNFIAYECENFNKMELAVNNISAKLKKNALTKKLGSLLDTTNQMTNENGKAILPVFVSESVTDYYYLKNPFKIKDYIKATHVNGIGVEDGSVISQMTGTLFQSYNFYDDWVSILEKQFPTPVNVNYKKYYYYKITDSSYTQNGYRLYQIQIKKRYKNDMLFSGTIWIDDSVYAIRQITLEVDKSANLNFIEKIKFQQEFSVTESGTWLPTKTRISLDIDQLTNNSAGFIAKFYSTSSKIKINKPHDFKFYEKQITVAEDAKYAADTFWQNKHVESGTLNDQQFYNMVDSIKKLPIVKSYVDYIQFFVSGYKPVGKFNLGPYLFLYNHNVVEGNRFRVGATTNYKFSNKHYSGGYVAYGTKDQRFKYNFFYEYIANRKHWTKFGIEYKDDNEAIGLMPIDNSATSNLFSAFSLFSKITSWSKVKYGKLYAEWAPYETVTGRMRLEYKTFEPTDAYKFAYYSVANNSQREIKQNFINASATVEIRYAKGDVFLQNDFSRINIGSLKNPAITLTYTKGFKGIGNSNFDYHKLKFAMKQSIYLRRWGIGFYQITATKYFNPLPYPLLDVQLGNQSFIYNSGTYSLMRFVEFVADESYSGFYEHNFEGGFLNRIKGVRTWKLRMFANVRGVWGKLSDSNYNLIPTTYNNETTQTFQRFEKIPYMEIGYGIENIFRLLRVDFVHRLTYIDKPNARPFGAFLSVQFKL